MAATPARASASAVLTCGGTAFIGTSPA
jgi:hypothetical protein